MLTDKRRRAASYRIPHIIYSDAYSSEMVAYADLVLPDTTYLERWDCISLLDRPIGGADGPADAIRQPVLEAGPRRAAVPGRADRSRRAARPARLRQRRTAARPTGDYPDYIVQPRAHARASARSPAGAAPTAAPRARARPIRTSSSRYVANECFWRHHLPPEQLYFKHANQRLSGAGEGDGASSAAPSRSCCSSTASRLQNFRLAARGPRRGAAAGRHRARGSARISIRCRSGIRRSRSAVEPRRLSAARDHPAADGDVPFLGLAERLAAPDPRPQPALHEPRAPARALGLADDDWVWVISRTRPDQGAGSS